VEHAATIFMVKKRAMQETSMKADGLHSIISQKIELTITTAVSTSNPYIMTKMLIFFSHVQ
jgi:hypothetical protein